MAGKHQRQSFAESGFGGWVDEKVEIAPEVIPLLSQKKSHPQHLTISQSKPSFLTDRGARILLKYCHICY
jgi:hypothetical protein